MLSDTVGDVVARILEGIDEAKKQKTRNVVARYIGFIAFILTPAPFTYSL